MNQILQDIVTLTDSDSQIALTLQLAASSGDQELVARLLGAGASVNGNRKATVKVPPLFTATIHGHTDIVRMLLERGADVDCADWFFTPLHVAINDGRAEIVRMLVEKGANVTRKVRNVPPLHVAASKGRTEIIRMLLENGADVDGVADGIAPLHLAAFQGHTEAVRALIDHGASMDCKDGEGMTPLHRAVSGGRGPCVSALLACGADPDVADAKGRTALDIAPKGSSCRRLLRAHASRRPEASESRPTAPLGEAEKPSEKTPRALMADDFFDRLRAEASRGQGQQILEQFSWAAAQLQAQALVSGGPAEAEAEAEEEDMLDAALSEAKRLVVDEDSGGPEPRPGDGAEEGPLPAARELGRPPRGGTDPTAVGEASGEGGGAAFDRPPLEEIELAPLAVRWLERAGGLARGMLLSRLDRLARGRRSYALSKRLQGTR